MTDKIIKLNTVAKDVQKCAPPATLERAGLFVVNDYNGTKYDLGDGPDNDAYNMAKMVGRHGFNNYYLRNATKHEFLHWLDYFFQNTSVHLVVFYVGHGTSVKDLQGDEADGFDEAFFFRDGVMIDDILIQHLCENKNPTSKLTLLTDACHSGSVWDIQGGNFKGRQLPENIISISAASDAQTAKQTVVEKQEQGMFSYNFRKLLKQNPDMTARELKHGLRTVLAKYNQTVNIATTTGELVDSPLMKP